MASSPSESAAPCVSVIVPTRNRGALLERALDGVLRQSWPDFEVIVVDDASTDDTAERLARCADPRLRVLREAQPGGGPRARNRAAAAARGRFLAFLDDDDEWLPEKLARQLAVFDAGPDDLGLVQTGQWVVSAVSGRVIHSVSPPAGVSPSPVDFLGEISMTTSVVMVRRDVFERVGGFDEALAGAQDRDLWIRLAAVCRFDAVPDPLVRRYLHGEQITCSLPAKIRAKQQLLAKHAAALRAHPRHRAHHLWRLGILQCVAGEVAAGRRALLAAICAAPVRRAAWRDLLSALGPARRAARVLAQRRIDTVDGIPLYY